MHRLSKCVIAIFITCVACAGGQSVNGTTAALSQDGTDANTTTPASPTSSNPNQTATFTIINKCTQTLWVALQSNGSLPLPSSTGAQLAQGQNLTATTIKTWGGRIWARTGCDFSSSPSCQTGDCGPLSCGGAGGVPPASWAEIKLDGDAGKDFYDVSLVDGYNVPVKMEPTAGAFTPDPSQGQYWCGAPTCTSDLLTTCPTELQQLNDQNQVVGCKSACLEFGTDAYCCKGANNTSATCPPTKYSEIFKAACPSQYSYAYDDPTSTFTCKSSAYTVTFCPGN